MLRNLPHRPKLLYCIWWT